MQRRNAVFLLVTVPPCVAWLLAMLFRFVQRAIWLRGPYYPTLPLVSLPFEPSRDVVSSVPALFIVLITATVVVLVADIGKFFSRQLPGGQGVTYVLLSCYQVILLGDMLRSYARDWWTWLLSWIGILALTDTPPLPDLSTRLPVISGLFLLLVITSVAVRLRQRPRG